VAGMNNLECPYCGKRFVPPLEVNTDHVVARRFVPKGFLDNAWNVKLRACKVCNGRKSKLEDVVSAASLHMPMPSWTDPDDDNIRRQEVDRRTTGAVGKGTERRKFLRKDRQPEKFRIESTSPNLNVSFDLTGPPGITLEALGELARMQVAGFVYFVTWDPATRLGRFVPGEFHVVESAGVNDWGNARQVAFMKHVGGWSTLLLADTAKGWFKVALRCDAPDGPLSWAFEWNKNYRAIGFAGESEKIRSHIAAMPPLPMTPIATSLDETLHMRLEQRLKCDEDAMFLLPAPAVTVSPSE
jgi:hypothetical protein